MAVQQERLLTRAFVILTVADLAYFAAAGVLIAVTPLFVTGPLTSDEAGVGLVMGAFSVTTLLLRPLAGRWTDRHGRRPLLIGGAAVFTVVVLGHFIVTGVAGLVVLRLALGAAEAAYFVAGFAALADLAPPGRTGEALSLNSLALYLGLVIGPVLGQALLRWGGFDLAWAGAVALTAIATLLASLLPETRPTQEVDAAPTPLVHRSALVPGVALMCGVATMAAFLAFAALHARAIGIETWSAVFALFGTTVVVCRIALAKLPDRVDPRRMSATALVGACVGLLTIGAVQTPAGLLAGVFILAVGTAFLTPAIFAMVFNATPPAERGSAAATTSIFIDLGLSGGPIVMGFVAASTGIGSGFLLLALLPVAGTVVLVTSPRRRPVTA